MATKYWINYLRVIAIFAVITIHTSAMYFVQFDQLDRFDWLVSNFLNTASRFSVPLFVMISGAVLLGKHITISEFYKKRFSRLIRPILFWSLFYLVVTWFQQDSESFKWLLSVGILTNGYVVMHLWYLTMFALLMLFAPFVNMLLMGIKLERKDILWLLLLIAGIFLLNSFSAIVMSIKNIDILWFKTFPWFMAYFLGGYYVDKYADQHNLKPSLMFLIIVVLVLFGTGLNYILATKFGVVSDSVVFGNSGFLVFVVTFCTFFIARKSKGLLKDNKLVSAISDASFGMYLIHPLFIDIFQLLYPASKTHVFPYLPAMMITVPVVSFFAIVMLRKSRFMRTVC